MSKIRCKFYVTSVTHHIGYRTFKLAPVYSSDPNHENKKYWDATPSGQLEITIKNDDVDMQVGQEYYLDLTPSN